MVKVVSVTPRDQYKLYVQYDDGVAGEVDLSHLVGKGVFAAWNDRAFFEAVTVGQHGEIKWGDDIDLCPDAIYLQLTGKSAEDLFPNLKAPADA